MSSVSDDISHEERMALAEAGKAMPDGSYPTGRIVDGVAQDSEDLLERAFQAYGRETESTRPSLRRYLVRRAVAMGRTDLIPENWEVHEA